jgi:hypothetical protein
MGYDILGPCESHTGNKYQTTNTKKVPIKPAIRYNVCRNTMACQNALVKRGSGYSCRDKPQEQVRRPNVLSGLNFPEGRCNPAPYHYCTVQGSQGEKYRAVFKAEPCAACTQDTVGASQSVTGVGRAQHGSLLCPENLCMAKKAELVLGGAIVSGGATLAAVQSPAIGQHQDLATP